MATKRPLDLPQAARILEPGSLALVTSLHRGRHNVMTASWLMPLGFDPPRLGVAIHPSRLTHELITQSETFGLSIPTLDLLNAVHRCGMESGRELDKFLTAKLTPVDAVEIDAPLVGECVAHIECGLVQRLRLTDHDLFVAEVLAVSAIEGLFTDRWQISGNGALIHHIAGDQYAGLNRAYRASLAEEE